MASVVVTGDKALDRTFRELGPALSKKFARKALRKSAKKVKAKAEQILEASPSIVSGELLKGIKVRAMKRSRSRVGVTIMTTSAEKSTGGFPLEFGTKHMPSEPFMRPSLYDQSDEIRGNFAADVNEAIAEAARKASAK